MLDATWRIAVSISTSANLPSELVAQLAANGWWGEIVGPHGSGKSTLLEALRPALLAMRADIDCTTISRWSRVVASAELPRWLGRKPLALATPTLVIIDGYEQLGWLQRLLLKRRCRRAGAGLLVTSHAPTGLPTLITLAPDLLLVQQLVATLCERTSAQITPADVTASHAGRGSNVRDIFFDLYDRHERLRRAD